MGPMSLLVVIVLGTPDDGSSTFFNCKSEPRTNDSGVTRKGTFLSNSPSGGGEEDAEDREGELGSSGGMSGAMIRSNGSTNACSTIRATVTKDQT